MGGAIAPFTSPLLVKALLMVLRYVISFVVMVWLLVRALPSLILAWLIGMITVVVGSVKEFVQTVRRL